MDHKVRQYFCFVNLKLIYLKVEDIELESLISVEEAAKQLGGISKWTIHAWLSQGKLRRTKVGRRTMIRQSELEKVIQDGGKSPAPNSRACNTRQF
jgi:excisionase family DNA binding protein